MSVENISDHRWLAQDNLLDGPIQNIAYYLSLVTSNPFIPLLGADPTGTVDSYNAIAQAVTNASLAGGTIGFGPGTFLCSGNVTWPGGVNFWGAGSGFNTPATLIRFTTAGAGFTVQGQGGLSGNLTLDGNTTATTPFLRNVDALGRGSERMFLSLEVMNSAQDNMTLLAAQNDQYHGCSEQSAARDGIYFDQGSGGHVFVGCEFSNAGRYGQRFDTQVAHVGGYQVPTDITFIGGLVERGSAISLVYATQGSEITWRDVRLASGTPSRQVTDGVTATDNTVVSASAAFTSYDVGKGISGTNIPTNSYIGTVVSANQITLSSSPYSNASVNTSGSGTGITVTISAALLDFVSGGFMLDNIFIQGSGTNPNFFDTAIRCGNAALLAIGGKPTLTNLLNGICLAVATPTVEIMSNIRYNSVTNNFSGAVSANSNIRTRLLNPLTSTIDTGSDYAYVVSEVGDAGARYFMTGSGVLNFADGTTFTADTKIVRVGAGQLEIGGNGTTYLFVDAAAAGSGVLVNVGSTGTNEKLTVSAKGTGGFFTGSVFFPVQATTTAQPAYVKGGMYFDTTANKLMIGGASGWETVTSS